MKDPAVLFYTSDFIAGTITMTDAQRGQYILLLCLQHQKGFLTEKDMIKICTSYDEDIWSKFIKDGDVYYNKRMKIEADKRRAYSESRSQNKKGKTKDKKIISKSYDNHMGNENINENIDKDKRFKPPTFKQVTDYCKERSNDICPQTFIDFYESKGWMIGKNKMKDWQAAVRTWEKTSDPKPKQPRKGFKNDFNI